MRKTGRDAAQTALSIKLSWLGMRGGQRDPLTGDAVNEAGGSPRREGGLGGHAGQ